MNKVTTANYIDASIINIRNFLLDNITDPIASTRPTGEKFVLTSYPQRPVRYPIITVKLNNAPTSKKMGQRSSLLETEVSIEIRVWARNEIEKDKLTQSVVSNISNIQYIAGGSVESNLYSFTSSRMIPIDEVGENAVKSNLFNINYKVIVGV
jgi:hypothetical protein